MSSVTDITGLFVAATTMYFFYKYAVQQARDNRRAIVDLTEAIYELKNYLQNGK